MNLPRLVFAAPARFFSLQQRHQAFARLLAEKSGPVIYLDPLQSPGFKAHFRQIQKNLQLLSLTLPFRAANIPVFHKLMVKLSYVLLKQKFKITKDSWLWISEPAMACLAENEWGRIIYDRCDLHGCFPGQNPRAWQYYENLLFERADLIVVSHPRLREDIPPEYNRKIELAENACSEKIQFVARRQPESGSLQLVSSGAHFEWVDCSWLKMLAQHEKVILHIAGAGRGRDFAELIRMPQVRFHGSLEHKELFKLYQQADVGLLPFADLELISAVDPIKVYEYAASGLRVWSTPLTSMKNNRLVERQIADFSDLERAVHEFVPVKNLPSVARWPERLQTILDRLARLQSD